MKKANIHATLECNIDDSVLSYTHSYTLCVKVEVEMNNKMKQTIDKFRQNKKEKQFNRSNCLVWKSIGLPSMCVAIPAKHENNNNNKNCVVAWILYAFINYSHFHSLLNICIFHTYIQCSGERWECVSHMRPQWDSPSKVNIEYHQYISFIRVQTDYVLYIIYVY